MSRSICKVICKECPFRRASAPGYLGESSGDPWDFLASFEHGESPLPCHMRVNWERPDAQEKARNASLCRGALTMLRNECKIPRDAELAEAVRCVEADREAVFTNRHEFMMHHFREELKFRND